MILVAIEREYHVARMHIDFSKKGAKKQLNELFGADGSQGMQERKNHISDNSVSPILGAFVYNHTGRVEEAPQTKAYMLYTELMTSMTTND